jgi:alkanesulfonate monooxygenase SsuD/methylene tetrahydromethanopterin reductase-like flavin-dependent oxidoreductase (luciferase family)
MIRFLVDENFNGKIVRGLRARNPEMDIVRVQDTEIYQASDPAVLEWAAAQGRILLTHDLDTMTLHAHERIAQGLPMAGAIFVRDTVPVSKIIDDILTIHGASEASEWENRTDFLPL